MELALNQTLQDAALDVLRETTPFRDAPEPLLRRIVAITRRARYAEGERVYSASGAADDIFVVVSGKVEHVFSPEVGAREPIKRITRGGVFGWAGLLFGQTQRLATVTATEPTQCLRIGTEELVRVLESDAAAGNAVMERFATMIAREFTVPELLAQVRRLSGQPQPEEMSSLGLTVYRLTVWLKSPRPYLMLVGFALFLGFWYFAVEIWKLPRFREMPGLTSVVREWISPSPDYGLSIYIAE